MVPARSFCATPCSSRRHDVERHDRQHGAVHGHRHGHLAERDAVEELAHVEDGIDRHAGHADIAGDARMVAVIAAMGGEVEGDRQALLAGGEVAAVEGVGFLGRREAGILPDRPGLLDIHGRVGAADEGRDARARCRERAGRRGRARRRARLTAMPSGVCQAGSSGAGARRGSGFGQAMLAEIGDHARPPIDWSMRTAASRSQNTAPSVGSGPASPRQASRPAARPVGG